MPYDIVTDEEGRRMGHTALIVLIAAPFLGLFFGLVVAGFIILGIALFS